MAYKDNIPVRKSWGQNFITDNNIVNKIIDVINPKSEDNIIEIGPGKGALTLPISKSVSKIHAIEIDPMLVDFLNEKNIENLEVLNEDILDVDINKFKNSNTIIGNLPYYITSPIIFKLLECENIKKMVFMVQKEVAERIVCENNNKNFSRISVMTQTFCDVELKFNVPNSVFYPKPKVDSSIITLNKKNTNINLKDYSDFIKTAFKQKRKKAKNNLKKILTEDGLKLIGDKRPENLSVNEYISLFNNYTLKS